jgi:Uma2 family endonuclease
MKRCLSMPLALNHDERYTYADYLTWEDDLRWELIEGVPYCMTPAPAPRHQGIVFELGRLLGNGIEKSGGSCRVYPAPLDVRLPGREVNDNEVDTVVQPDISVICDASKIDEKGCLGAPDICVEVLSESSAYRDETDKLFLYEKHGVREYWIVNPEGKYIMVYRHGGDRFHKPDYYRIEDTLESDVLMGLAIKLEDIFRE